MTDSRLPEMPAPADDERHLVTLRPSARAAIPVLGVVVILAVIATVAVLAYRYEIHAVMQVVDEVLNWVGPEHDTPWIAILLTGIWVGALLHPSIRLLELKTTSYTFTSQRLRYARGILHRRRDQLELARIRDLSTSRPLLQRMLGIGTLTLDTVDRTHPKFVIEAQRDVYALKEWIHRLNVQERERLGYREFEGTHGPIN